MDEDYSVTVQVFGRAGERIGQRDSYTGLGAYPTSEWATGEVIVDTIRVTLDPDADAPGEAVVEAGLYDPASLDRLPATDAEGRTLGRTLVARFKLAPRKSPRHEWDHPAGYTLGERVALLGYNVDGGELSPGGVLPLTLYWQALAPMETDYTVFVHLLDASGAVRAQRDAPPLDGDYPTSLWDEGEVVKDPHAIPLPPDLSPGRYQVALGLYSLGTMERLPVLDGEDVRQSDARILLWEGEIE
jgi:hypothetical protein